MSENNGHFRTAEGLPATECRTNPSAKDGPTNDALALIHILSTCDSRCYEITEIRLDACEREHVALCASLFLLLSKTESSGPAREKLSTSRFIVCGSTRTLALNNNSITSESEERSSSDRANSGREQRRVGPVRNPLRGPVVRALPLWWLPRSRRAYCSFRSPAPMADEESSAYPEPSDFGRDEPVVILVVRRAHHFKITRLGICTTFFVGHRSGGSK